MSEAIKKETETKNLLKISWRKLQGLLSNNSLKSIRRNYGVPLTNAGESVKVAMDNALEASGHFTTIRNAVASGGIDAYPQFLGYAYLSGLQQNGFIRAGVEGLADDMTARFIELIRTSDIENNDDDKINKINEYLNAFQIKELFNKAAALNGYFGGCLIFIDTGDEDLLSALDEKSLNHSIKNFVLVEPINTYPGRFNSSNPLAPNYFVPETWFVLGKEVHASRLLYLAADEVSMLLKPAYNFFGIAPAQIAADSVSHFIKDREAASRLLHKYSLLVFKTDMGSALYSGNPEELYSRVKVLADFRDNNSVIIIDKEDEDIVTVTTSLAGVTDVVRLSLELMPIMFRQPLTKFLGISPGGMNATGESDENNWNEYVLSQCEKQLRKPVKRLLELIQYDLFGEVDECIDFIFKVQSSNDEVKEINNNKIKADTYVQLTTAGIISPEEARKALAEDEKSGFNSIDVDAVPEMELGGAFEASPFPTSPLSETASARACRSTAEQDKLIEEKAGNEDLFSAFDEWKENEYERDENGRFKGNSDSKKNNNDDIQTKIDSLNSIDFSRDNKLPNLNKDTLEQYGFEDKPVILKKNIIEKNKTNHPDITDDMAREIIGNSLYKPEAVLKANKEKPAYHNFITRLDDDKNSIVLLELSEEKDNYEIVNYHYLDDYGVRKKEKKDINIRS